MRKKNFLLTGTFLLICWATIQFYLFVHKPQFIRFRKTKTFSWLVDNDAISDDGIINETSQTQPDMTADSRLLENRLMNNSSESIYQQKNEKELYLELISKKLEQFENDLNKQFHSNDQLFHFFKKFQQVTSKFNDDNIYNNRSMKNLFNDKNFLKSLDESLINNQLILQRKPKICVLMFACNRITVKRSLDQLFKYRNDPEIFPIVVSQDCNHERTRQVIESYGDKLLFIQQPDQSDIVLEGKNQKKFKGYYRIARHYAWALNYTFNVLNYETVLIVEDDLDIASDFFEYFLALYPILHSDSSLYCISAWNDNGKKGLVDDDPTKLFRSDFFPGLGWMLTKDLWLEFQNKWPKAFWDDWIRQPEQRKNRACIRPEVSRTKTFGKKGVSNGLFYEKHLKFIQLNEKYVPFTKMNLTYLKKEYYDVEFLRQVFNSRLISMYEVKKLPKIINTSCEMCKKESDENRSGDLSKTEKNLPNVEHKNQSENLFFSPLFDKHSVRIQYNSRNEFRKAAKMFGLMEDFKSGVPRTGYLGTVGFFTNGYRVYLSPSPMWNGYNVTWK
ncbi:phosphatidylinositol-binding clathrin assembly protein LAP [Sarcoptes scabiei]|nr:phosphatidylinositol-binding clathrin assembly protein LAP [Sarcoptes scabiei]